MTLIAAVAALTSCSHNPKDVRLAQIKDRLDELSPYFENCNQLEIAMNQAKGEVDLADADAALGKGADKIKSDEEWEYRRDISARTGILPSQANGWKDIIKSQGKIAKREKPRLEGVSTDAQRRYQEECADYLARSEERDRLNSEADRLNGV